MKTVNFEQDVIGAIAAELGIDPALDLQRDQVAAWVRYVNNWTEDAWELWDWPELDITEERPFRTIWNSTRTFFRAGAKGQPDQFFYLPTFSYYQVLATAPSDPPAGTLPTNATYFAPLPTFYRFLDYELAGRRAMGVVKGVYPSDPRQTVGPYGLRYRPAVDGLEIQSSTALTVFVRYQAAPSIFTSALYDLTKAYNAGDLVFWTAAQGGTGQVYRAISAVIAGTTPATVASWALVPMPRVLRRYVVYQAAANAAEDPTLKGDLETKAANALGRSIDNLLSQGQQLPGYRIGYRAGVRIPYGLTGWLESIGWGAGAPSTVTTLTDTYLNAYGEPA